MISSVLLRPVAALAMLVALLFHPAPSVAQSAEARERIRAAVEGFSGGRLKVDDIRRTPLPGIYEVRIQNELLYVDERGQYLFYSGDLIDMKSQRNLTRERVEELLTIDFRELPLELAVTQKIGAGRRVLAVFESQLWLLPEAARRSPAARRRHPLHLPDGLSRARLRNQGSARALCCRSGARVERSDAAEPGAGQ